MEDLQPQRAAIIAAAGRMPLQLGLHRGYNHLRGLLPGLGELQGRRDLLYERQVAVLQQRGGVAAAARTHQPAARPAAALTISSRPTAA